MRRCLWLGPRRKMRHPLAQRAARGPLGRHATPKRLSTFVPSWFWCAAPLRPPAARHAGCDTGAWADLFASSAARLKRRCTCPHRLAPRCSRAPWQRPRVDRCVPGNNLSRPPPTFAWARPAARGLCSSTAALLWRARPPHGAQGQAALPPSRRRSWAARPAETAAKPRRLRACSMRLSQDPKAARSCLFLCVVQPRVASLRTVSAGSWRYVKRSREPRLACCSFRRETRSSHSPSNWHHHARCPSAERRGDPHRKSPATRTPRFQSCMCPSRRRTTARIPPATRHRRNLWGVVWKPWMIDPQSCDNHICGDAGPLKAIPRPLRHRSHLHGISLPRG